MTLKVNFYEKSLKNFWVANPLFWRAGIHVNFRGLVGQYVPKNAIVQLQPCGSYSLGEEKFEKFMGGEPLIFASSVSRQR
jgi:hypothetical protein